MNSCASCYGPRTLKREEEEGPCSVQYMAMTQLFCCVSPCQKSPSKRKTHTVVEKKPTAHYLRQKRKSSCSSTVEYEEKYILFGNSPVLFPSLHPQKSSAILKALFFPVGRGRREMIGVFEARRWDVRPL